jgi:PAB1-binding protein PBP1
MSCCKITPYGAAKGTTLSRTTTSHNAGASVGRPSTGVSGAATALRLRYIGTTPVRAYGPFTHQPYDFAPSQVRTLDARDATALLRSPMFHRV